MNAEETVLRLAEKIKHHRAVTAKKKKAGKQVQDLRSALTQGKLTLHNDTYVMFITKDIDDNHVDRKEIIIPRECTEALMSFLLEEMFTNEVPEDKE